MPKSNIQTNLLSDNGDFSQGHVFISLPNSGQGGERINALMQGEFTISGGNAFNNPLASTAQESLSEKINIGKAAIESAANLAGKKVNLGSQIQLKTLNQTSLFWTGSQKPTFNLDLLFIALRRGDDVRTQVESLYQTVFPTLGKGGVFLRAPLGYNVNGRGEATGTFAVQLGQWFRATRQVMTNVTFTYSQEMIPLDGDPNGAEPTKFAPLFARGSISFEPFRDITFREFQGYFLK